MKMRRRFVDGDDEWERVLHPRHRVSSHMYADIPRSPCNHRAMPVAGLIFMCDSVVRACILRHENLRMPVGPKCIEAARVRPGAKLFIFEVGCRILWGVYEVTSPPHIIRSRCSYPEEKLPYQLYFRTLYKCQPLSEKVFKHAIKDNYYEPHKFHLDLREDQVIKLMALFSSIKDKEIKTNCKIVPVNTGRPQRVLSLDNFPDANNQTFTSSMIKGQDNFFCSPASFRGVLQQDQIKDNLQIKPECHSYACSINRSGRSHLTSNDELLNCDLTLGRTETSLICKPGYKQVLGSAHLQDSFEDPRQGHPDIFSLEDGELLERKSIQDLHGLHNVTLQLSIDVPVKDLGCGNFYEKSRTFDCTNSQVGPDKYDLDLVKAELQDTAYSPATGKTESLPDQNVYCDLHDKMEKNVHYGYGNQEDIELCSVRLASCPLPSAFSPPVDAVSTRNFLEILEHTLISVSKVHRISTPDSTPQVADMGDGLAQNKGIENHAAHKDDAQVENQGHNLLAATLGKRIRIIGASAVSCGDKKKKQSNWLRLSCPSPKQEMIL